MTKIPWTEKTWNPVVGCTKVSPGCKNCYAEKMARRLRSITDKQCLKNRSQRNLTNAIAYGTAIDKKTGNWSGDMGYRRYEFAKITPRQKPKMIFVCSMGDLFHPSVPFGFIADLYEVIAKCPQHTFQILTKRPEIAKEFYRKRIFNSRLLTNLWLGVSAENQEWWEKRKKAFFATPAAIHFVSFEPLLGEIILTDEDLKRLDQVIIGAESKGAYPGRLCQGQWVGDIVRQCEGAKIPCFVKQLHQHFGKPEKRRLVKSEEVKALGWPQEHPKGE